MNLVTGASGFIGGRIVHALASRGEEIRILARPGANLEGLAGINYQVAAGDILDEESLAAAVKGCRRIYHVAALYTLWSRSPELIYETNVEGTRNVIRAAMAANVDRIVYTSSVATIGLPDGGIGTEQTPVSLQDMVGDYKKSKFLAESVVSECIRQGAPIVIVNPTFPVGCGDMKPTPTGEVILRFLSGGMPAYLDTGLNVVDVDDVAAGHLLAADKGRIGQRYILGNKNMTLQEILQVLADITGLPAPRIRLPYYPVFLLAKLDAAMARLFPRHTPNVVPDGVKMARKKMFVDPSKAVRELGLPQTPATVALGKSVDWFRSHHYA